MNTFSKSVVIFIFPALIWNFTHAQVINANEPDKSKYCDGLNDLLAGSDKIAHTSFTFGHNQIIATAANKDLRDDVIFKCLGSKDGAKKTPQLNLRRQLSNSEEEDLSDEDDSEEEFNNSYDYNSVGDIFDLESIFDIDYNDYNNDLADILEYNMTHYREQNLNKNDTVKEVTPKYYNEYGASDNEPDHNKATNKDDFSEKSDIKQNNQKPVTNYRRSMNLDYYNNPDMDNKRYPKLMSNREPDSVELNDEPEYLATIINPNWKSNKIDSSKTMPYKYSNYKSNIDYNHPKLSPRVNSHGYKNENSFKSTTINSKNSEYGNLKMKSILNDGELKDYSSDIINDNQIYADKKENYQQPVPPAYLMFSKNPSRNNFGVDYDVDKKPSMKYQMMINPRIQSTPAKYINKNNNMDGKFYVESPKEIQDILNAILKAQAEEGGHDRDRDHYKIDDIDSTEEDIKPYENHKYISPYNNMQKNSMRYKSNSRNLFKRRNLNSKNYRRSKPHSYEDKFDTNMEKAQFDEYGTYIDEESDNEDKFYDDIKEMKKVAKEDKNATKVNKDESNNNKHQNSYKVDHRNSVERPSSSKAIDVTWDEDSHEGSHEESDEYDNNSIDNVDTDYDDNKLGEKYHDDFEFNIAEKSKFENYRNHMLEHYPSLKKYMHSNFDGIILDTPYEYPYYLIFEEENGINYRDSKFNHEKYNSKNQGSPFKAFSTILEKDTKFNLYIPFDHNLTTTTVSTTHSLPASSNAVKTTTHAITTSTEITTEATTVATTTAALPPPSDGSQSALHTRRHGRKIRTYLEKTK